MSSQLTEIQLAEIKKRRAAVEGMHDDHTTWWWLGAHDVPWLIGQVEQGQREIERLRGLLRGIEWVYVRDGRNQVGECPACWSVETAGHDPDCSLAAEIRATDLEAKKYQQ